MLIRKITRRIPRPASKSRFFLLLAIVFAAIVILTGSIFTLRLYLESRRVVEGHLKGQVWSLPSIIYADAPMLYEGMPLKPGWLVDYLQKLNYFKSQEKGLGTGQYSVLNDGVVFEEHNLFQGNSTSFPVRVRFADGSVKSISNVKTGEDLPAVELEPIPITDLFGKEWEKRTLVRYEDLPPHLVSAVIAIEDRRFYSHGGVDIKGIMRALFNDMLGRKQLQGGSTITQQLVKNFYLTPERSLKRKVSEAMMAWILEGRQSKNQIMEMYLNEVYLGQRGGMSINGVGEASRLYFRKDVDHISVPEAALLAGMIQAPNVYNPYKHAEEAKRRRNTVLLAMKNTGVLSDQDYERYAATPIVVYPIDTRVSLAPYFGDVVKNQLLEKYKADDIYTRNLRIFTTLDLDMQGAAEEAVSNGLQEIDKLRFKRTKKNVEGCLIAIEPQTGYIRAFVGGRSYSKSQYDRISQAVRQPGSTFKPVVYATAIEQAFKNDGQVFTPATLVDDSPWTLKFANQVWEPKNYDGQYHGVVNLRAALAESMNVATAKLAMDVGLKKIADLGHTLGFPTVQPFPSIALGTFEVSPWQVASAYTVFANGGVKTELRTIEKVADANGQTLERSQIEVRRVLHPQTAYILTDMMQSVIDSGTGSPARRMGFTRPAAGKTGTTDEYRDAWFVGYTPNLLCVVWTGYDDNTPIRMTGAQAALPIWVEFMKKATKNAPVEQFISPQGIVVKMIDPTTGQLATKDCPYAVPEKFVEGTEPTQPCQQHSSHWWNIFG